MTGPAASEGTGAIRFEVAYGLGHFGKSLVWYSSHALFAFFLTEICGVPAAAMGLVLAADLLFSGAADVGFGAVLARHVRSVTQAASLQLPAAILSGLALIAFAATPFVGAAPVRIACALASCAVFRLAYSFQDVPQNGILYLVEGGVAVRIRLASVRFIAAGLASLLIAAATPAVLITGDAATGAGRFLLYVVAIVAVWFAGAVGLWLLSPSAKPSTLPQNSEKPGKSEKPEQPGRRTAAEPVLLGGFASLLAMLFVMCGGDSVFGKLEPYFAAGALTTTPVRTAVLVAVSLGSVATQPVWVWISRRCGLVATYRMGALAMGAGAGLFFLGVRFGPAAAALAGLIMACGVRGLSTLLWAGLADIMARWRPGSGAPAPTLAMGGVTAAVKLAAALATLGIGQLLSRIDFHNPAVARSWVFLLPMTAAPFLAACVCLVGSFRIVGPSPGARPPAAPVGEAA